MNMMSIAKGAAAGAFAGITVYALSNARPMKKMSIKRDAGKTIKAASDLLSDIKSVIM
jgi:outer membrane lipoprotein SlyB